MSERDRLEKTDKDEAMSVYKGQHQRELEMVREPSSRERRLQLVMIDDQGRVTSVDDNARPRFTPNGFLYIP